MKTFDDTHGVVYDAWLGYIEGKAILTKLYSGDGTKKIMEMTPGTLFAWSKPCTRINHLPRSYRYDKHIREPFLITELFKGDVLMFAGCDIIHDDSAMHAKSAWTPRFKFLLNEKIILIGLSTTTIAMGLEPLCLSE